MKVVSTKAQIKEMARGYQYDDELRELLLHPEEKSDEVKFLLTGEIREVESYWNPEVCELEIEIYDLPMGDGTQRVGYYSDGGQAIIAPLDEDSTLQTWAESFDLESIPGPMAQFLTQSSLDCWKDLHEYA